MERNSFVSLRSGKASKDFEPTRFRSLGYRGITRLHSKSRPNKKTAKAFFAFVEEWKNYQKKRNVMLLSIIV